MGIGVSKSKHNTDVHVEEGFVNSVANNRANNMYGTEDVDFVCETKGIHSIVAMKRLEDDKNNKQTNNVTNNEKFKGFAYKNNNIEPFEKVYISY